MTLWLAIGAVAVVNVLLKAAGPALLGSRRLPARATQVVDALAPALLAGLLAAALLGGRWRGVDWTVLPGLAVLVVLWARRVRQLVTVPAAVLVTVAVRMLA